MNLKEAREALAAYQRTMAALGHASGLVYYDGATIAPKKSAAVRPNTLGELSRISYELSTAPSTEEMLLVLRDADAELTPIERRSVSEMLRSMEKMRRIPKEEYVAYTMLLSESDSIWHDAKERSDFAAFAPTLGRVFDLTKKIAVYMSPELSPYDAALDQYERGMTRQFCDTFFSALRDGIVPLLARIRTSEQIDDSPLRVRFPIEAQRAFSSDVMDMLALDRDACILGETEHPFTINFSKNDVRITTHYYEDAFASSLYSVIHEGGHALYELGTGDDLIGTGLDSGVSMAIHESQSRFYENIIGRSRAFTDRLLPVLQRHFPAETAGITPEALYRMVNRSEPSLIRTEADELTYCLHVMVRYELEKAMFDGAIRADELAGEWNRLYKEYLGVTVPDDRSGVLQDSHWANGNIGYFPSYALGSAYGAQLLSVMEGEFDVYGAITAGEMKKINGWLEEKIWRHGCMTDPLPLFESVCGKFDPAFYIRYLTKKFEEIYAL